MPERRHAGPKCGHHAFGDAHAVQMLTAGLLRSRVSRRQTTMGSTDSQSAGIQALHQGMHQGFKAALHTRPGTTPTTTSRSSGE